MPTIVPRYLHFDLCKHVKRNVSRLRLRAHTSKVEAAAWLKGGSHAYNQYPGGDGMSETRTQQLDPICCNRARPTTSLFIISFSVDSISSQTLWNTRPFPFLYELASFMHTDKRVFLNKLSSVSILLSSLSLEQALFC